MSEFEMRSNSTKHKFVPATTRQWKASSQVGVERWALERNGASMHATSIVRFAPGCGFATHLHHLSEEILVLDGVFSDESGDFRKGAYLRNPAGSSHGPYSAQGCSIFIKVWPMTPADGPRIAIDTATAAWAPAGATGHSRLVLHSGGVETVVLERLAPGAEIPARPHEGGEELFVVEGRAESAEFGALALHDWICNPASEGAPIGSAGGALLWAKRGHLRRSQ